MKVAELKAYEVFKNKFGEKEANVNGQKLDDRLKDFKKIFATKYDISKVETTLPENRSEMIK